MEKLGNKQEVTGLVSRISIPGTFLALKVGESIKIPTRVVKTHSLRAAATRLKNSKKGLFQVSDADLIDETKVTRLE